MAKDLQKILKRWEDREVFFKALLDQVCRQVTRSLRQYTPGKTLPLQWEYDVDVTGDTASAKVWNRRVEEDPSFEEIMFYLDLGTSDHWIFPVNKLALSWVHNGKRYFSKGHKVSGIKASDFSARAEIVIFRFQGTIERKWDAYMSHGRLPR